MLVLERKHRNSAKAQLAEYLRSAIRENKFRVGDRLPVTKEFIRSAGVSSNTVRLAMDELVREGLLKATPGLGTFVVDPKEAAAEQVAVKRIGILPIFHRLNIVFPEDRYRVESVRGFLEECERRGAVALTLPTTLVDMEPQKAAAVLKITNCQGLVWLYPTPNEWRIIEYLHSINFPVVVTQRSTVDENGAFVGADYEKAGVNLGKYFIENGCEKVLILYFEQAASPNLQNYCGWPVGIKHSIARAYEVLSNDAEGKIQQLHLPGCMGEDQSRLIFERLENSDIPAVVFTNATHLHNIFAIDSDRAYSLLKGRKVCVVGNRSLLEHIAPYVKDLDIKVLVDPFVDIAKCAAQKLVALIDGDLAGTTTLVNVEFKEFGDL